MVNHSQLRYDLALQVVEFLLSNAKVIRRVYLYGSITSNSAGPTSDIDLIIEVERKSKYLEGLIQICDAELMSEYKNIMKGQAPDLENLLDIKFIDAEDINLRGPVENMHYNPPIKIYDVEEVDKAHNNV